MYRDEKYKEATVMGGCSPAVDGQLQLQRVDKNVAISRYSFLIGGIFCRAPASTDNTPASILHVAGYEQTRKRTFRDATESECFVRRIG
jgi:hypothetical protein